LLRRRISASHDRCGSRDACSSMGFVPLRGPSASNAGTRAFVRGADDYENPKTNVCNRRRAPFRTCGHHLPQARASSPCGADSSGVTPSRPTRRSDGGHLAPDTAAVPKNDAAGKCQPRPKAVDISLRYRFSLIRARSGIRSGRNPFCGSPGSGRCADPPGPDRSQDPGRRTAAEATDTSQCRRSLSRAEVRDVLPEPAPVARLGSGRHRRPSWGS
jgi:hypothetical protein